MTKQTVLFATGNKYKIHEARVELNKYGIDVKTINIEIDEIQHSDPAEITKAKARAAYAVLREPVVVQDASWSIPALGGFPGGYMKDTAYWWQAQDWMNIMAPYEDRRIICHDHVAYFDGEAMHHFEANYEGAFVDAPRGNAAENNSLELCISLNGSETFAEQHDRGGVGSADDGAKHWQLFGEWLSKR